MNIMYVWDADYPWDVRVEKICKSLARHGHQVHIVARNLNKRDKEEFSEGLHIHRLKSWKNDQLNYILSFPLFFSPVWLRRLNQVTRDFDIQLIIVRDLPMAIAAIWVGRWRGVPVLFDMAEDYVSMIREIWKNDRYRGVNLIVRNPLLARAVERYALKRVTHTLVVVDEMQNVVTDGGGNPDKITIVGNTPPLQFFLTSQPMPAALRPLQGRFKVIYTGGLEAMRGLQIMISALPLILAAKPDLVFIVIGDGPNRKALSGLADELGVTSCIHWLGWVPHDQLVSYLRHCDIGIIPHLVSKHVDTTVPNKLFDYMGCGLPVIASDARPMKRILEHNRAGITYNSGDSTALAAAILEMAKSDFPYGENGKQAVQNEYHWAIDESRLMALTESFSR